MKFKAFVWSLQLYNWIKRMLLKTKVHRNILLWVKKSKDGLKHKNLGHYFGCSAKNFKKSHYELKKFVSLKELIFFMLNKFFFIFNLFSWITNFEAHAFVHKMNVWISIGGIWFEKWFIYIFTITSSWEINLLNCFNLVPNLLGWISPSRVRKGEVKEE